MISVRYVVSAACLRTAVWAVMATCALALAGCSSQEEPAPTVVRVIVETERQVRTSTNAVRLRVTRGDGSTALDETVAPERTIELALEPRAGVAEREYTVIAQALDESKAVLATARVRSHFVAERTLYVRLVLEDACLGVRCGRDQTCHAAQCVDAEVDAARFGTTGDTAPSVGDLVDVGALDGGLDGGSDAELDAAPEGEPCTQIGARDCLDEHQPRVCDGTQWKLAPRCDDDEVCDGAEGGDQGTCSPIEPTCAEHTIGEGFCVGKALRVCEDLLRYEDTSCGAHAACMTKQKADECACVDGYARDAKDKCVDVDECKTDNGGCDPVVDCINEPGTRSCGACPQYYVGDGEEGCAVTLVALQVRDAAPLVATPIDVPLEPTKQRVEMPLSVTDVEISPWTLETGSATIEGNNVSSQAWWPAPPLATGSNVFEIVASEPDHRSSTYTLDVVRGSQDAYIKASNTDAQDTFGSAVAVSGDTLAVGAAYESSSASGIGGEQLSNDAVGAGAAYVFVHGLGWAQQAYVKASNPGAGDNFGRRIALDGDTLVVGAAFEDSDATPGATGNENAAQSGAVYVFVRNAGVWTQQAMLKAANAEAGDNFGDSLAIVGDTLIIGAPLEDSGATGVDGDAGDNSVADSGAVYVFERSGTTWTQVAYLKASNPGADDRFGRSVALDGALLVVGASGEDSAAEGVNGNQSDEARPGAGAAYVFRNDAGTFSQEAYLKASNTGAGDGFGYRVAIEGTTILVSAPYEAGADPLDSSSDGAADAGAVYVFGYDALAWSEQQYIKAAAPHSGDWFGIAIAISGDRMLVGASFESTKGKGFCTDDAQNDLGSSGAVYVLERTEGTFSHFAYAKARNAGEADLFGYYIAMSDDWLVVSAVGEASGASGIDGDDARNDAMGAGAVYVLR